MTDASQVGHIAGRFRDLQGLRQVVGGVGLLLLFGVEVASPMSPADVRAKGIEPLLWALAVLAVAIPIAVVAFIKVTAWYRRNFGLVEQTARRRRLGKLIGGGGALVFVIPFEVDSLATTAGQSLPVNAIDFTLALWIIGYWLYLGRQYRHYLVLAGIGFVLGFVSIAGITPATFAWHVQEATLYIAVASIVGGLIDHRILTRALSQPEIGLGIES